MTRFFLFSFICFLSVMGIAHAQDVSELVARIASLEEQIAAQQTNSDHIWTMIATALVFTMQGGFLLLEAGMTRTKNSISVATKNLIDFFLAVVIFYLLGFSIMFGTTHYGLWGWDWELSTFAQTEDWNYTFFLFQAVFAGTAGTIVSGAVAERMQLSAYIFITIFIAVFIYPFVGHWG